MEIKVPMLPPAECSPNWRGHWAERYTASKGYKEAVGWSVKSEMQKVPYHKLDSGLYLCEFPWDKAEMSLTFVVKEERIRDEDNWRARFKPGQDALVEAGLLVYDDLKHLTIRGIEFKVDKDKAPQTVIEIHEI